MDFSLGEEQLAVEQSAAALFGKMATPDRVAVVENGADRFDDVLWAELARADLLGIALPSAWGGSGMGMLELCSLLQAQGRYVAPVPLWSTLVLGAMPVAEFGADSLKERLLPGVASGEVRLTAALNEAVAAGWGLAGVTSASREGQGSAGARASRGWAGVRAERDGDGWRLSGRAFAVPQAHLATRVLVPALGADGQELAVLVDPAMPGASLERALTTDRQVHPHLTLDGVRVPCDEVLGAPGMVATGAEVVSWVTARGRTGLCAIALGACEEALRMTASYLDEREQFGRPLSSFQGVLLKAADAAIDIEAVRVTLWEAAWRLDSGRPASEAVAVANWWASEAGQRVVHATQHLHGGVGADISYPVHRYFLWVKQIELMLGSPSAQLAELGKIVTAKVAEVAEVADLPEVAEVAGHRTQELR